MEGIEECEDSSDHCSSSSLSAVKSKQDINIAAQTSVTKNISTVGISCGSKEASQKIKTTHKSQTPRKGQHNKSPSKSLKRTPKKNLLKIKASFTTPKKRHMSDDNASNEFPSKRLKKNDDNQMDNREEGLKVEDDEKDGNLNVDVALEEKADKIKMNAKNVKSVIHHVLTNEHVMSMFKSVLDLESSESVQKNSETPKKCFTPDKLECVPKLTRAKVKDILEKVCVPSPIKSVKDGPSILDVEFAEEEDDDEYNPEKDEECHESDDDESMVSSQVSDFGSPCPATPSTPITRNTLEESTSTTPVQPAQGELLQLGTPRNLVSEFNKSVNPSTEQEVDTIALRTRSKLPLTSTSITEIESAFVAPDITPDLYDNTYEDADWAQFLSSLCKPTVDETITDDDADANDPEFNYIAEAEREKPDMEDFRFDKPTQITKKELTSLLNELNDMFEDELLPHQVVASVPDMSGHLQEFRCTSSSVFTEFKAPQPVSMHQNVGTNQPGQHEASFTYEVNQTFVQNDHHQQQYNVVEYNDTVCSQEVESLFTPGQLALLEDNLRKHVQLLIQSFILFQGQEFQIEHATSPQAMLFELEKFRLDSSSGQGSIYNVCNLNPAIELLKDKSLFLPDKPGLEKPSVIQWKPEVRCTLTELQQKAVYNSTAFIYPSFLPTLKKGKNKTDRKYNKFLPSEDNLIALGLEQFQYCRNVNPVELIHKYLIRGKNANQIHFRIQFMSSPKVGDNPIKSVKKTGKLPDDFPTPVVDEYCPVAPKDQISDNLPMWCLTLKKTADLTLKKCQSFVSQSPGANSKSKRRSNMTRLTSGARSLEDSRTQTLPTIILPNSMPPVSGIFIQFGTSAHVASNQMLCPSPFPAIAQNIVAQANWDSNSCGSSSQKAFNSTPSQMELCLKPAVEKHKDKISDEELRPANVSPSSPDVLAKTMLSCGIQESPDLSQSTSSVEPFITSTPYQTITKHPIVRNLTTAFDAAHTASQKSNSDANSIAQAPVVSEAGNNLSHLENSRSQSQSDKDATLKACRPGVTTSLHLLSDSVSDHEMNLVIEESDNPSSSQKNTLLETYGKAFSSGTTESVSNDLPHPIQLNDNKEEKSVSSENYNMTSKSGEINQSDFVFLNQSSPTSKNCAKKENSRRKSVKCSKKQETVNKITQPRVSNQIVSHSTTSLKDLEAKTPTKLRSLAPKPDTPSTSYTPLPKMSPRRKELNKQVRQILPKSFVFEAKSPSPTKAAALLLKKKATMLCHHQRSPVKILPKSPQPIELASSRPRVILTPSRMYTRSQHVKTKNPVSTEICQEDVLVEKCQEVVRNEVNEAEDLNLSQEEEEEDEAFGEDDQIQLEDLMAASTTIRYDPKKGNSMDSDTKTKSQRRKDVCLAMLDSDLIERDPKKDERDTAYAQIYFNSVKEVLKDDPERFRKFLFLLHSQNKDHCNPIELYADLAILLSDHQDLVDDFAGFLLAFQAVECQCFVSSLEYQQIRSFLRQLEIYCDTSTITFQRTLKMMSKWLSINQDAHIDTTPFKDRITSVLRHVPGLMDDLLAYFFDGPMPECHPDDFEHVTLDEVYDVGDTDKFEEVTLPEGRENYNTKLCTCKCHEESRDEKFVKRRKHCVSCSLKMFEGKPILKMYHHTDYHDVSIIYPLEEKEKLRKAKKEAALIALAKARAQRQQKKKNKKKLSKIKAVETKRKKKIKKRKSHKVSISEKYAFTSSDSKNPEDSVAQTLADSGKKEAKENKEESVMNKCDNAPVLIPSKESDGMSDSPASNLIRSTYTNIFMPSATSSPINIKSSSSSSTSHTSSIADSISHANLNSLTETVPLVVSDSTTADKPCPGSSSNVTLDNEIQNPSHQSENTKQPPTRTKSSTRVSKTKRSKTSTVALQPEPITPMANPHLPASMLQPISLIPPITNSTVRFPTPVAHHPSISTTPIIHTRIPVMVFLQPQETLPESPKKEEPRKPSTKKSRKSKSEASKATPSLSTDPIQDKEDKLCDEPVEIGEQNTSTPIKPVNEECSQIVHSPSVKIVSSLSKSPLGIEQMEPSPPRTSSYENSDERDMHTEVATESVPCASSTQNRTLLSTIDLHTSDTSSLFHFSPSKFKGKIPDVVKAYLDNFSLGGFDESMDIHVHQLAQAMSPGKSGNTSSRFNLLAYLESSNLTLKDGTNMGVTKSVNETETRLSFSGALSEPENSMPTKESGRINDTPLDSTTNVQTVPVALQESNKVKEASSSKLTAEVTPEVEDTDEWSEDWDRSILTIVAEEGITALSLKKIQHFIPEKSTTEIQERAKFLLQMLQTVGDSESDTGVSCDDSSNM
ncbi:uncharacterized protein LOC106072261 isoform X1 [Biomphalaria glabrata]|uniref:Uncharacterized protein LOC106072261 isoform X1 n=1 Tax=Biomphalaria glabrata TaxID=6526 RepID=A0A9W2YJ38_BIOGL|nr:uncharacterized protein LOC106072261 isoform X1 [Biomphalaria glabrata]XP_055862846.1 uncharacterized protein LOC106072261 isoform X1 [Biomphalaria glabrata]XP_055862853.1 uncharacterized protein LOC106072261 isoform X1 [Biomphalaria glabrata]XP_055862860.1 uncharacterized protein LOC106072261 isoform X1 [Biomphalaria glabrata]